MALKDILLERLVRPSECGELSDKTVYVNRVAKVVKGGKRFSFNALVVTGDKQGAVGFGLGKAAEVPDAIRKASEQARKNLIKVGLRGTTVPHEVHGKFRASHVILRPAPPGTGVIAGATVRAVVEATGIQDIVTKVVGRSNPFNVLQATFAALALLRAPEAVADARGMKLEALEYAPF